MSDTRRDLKTIALKVDNSTADQLAVIAQLEGRTVTELVREAVERHLEAKQADGSLAARAEAVLAEIEQEAKSKKDALSALLNTAAGGTSKTGPTSTRGRARKNPDQASSED